MKPGKHQKSKQTCQDLCCKVHDCAQSLFFAHTPCMNYLPKRFYFLVPQYRVNNYCVLCKVKAPKKRTNTCNKEICWVS